MKDANTIQSRRRLNQFRLCTDVNCVRAFESVSISSPDLVIWPSRSQTWTAHNSRFDSSAKQIQVSHPPPQERQNPRHVGVDRLVNRKSALRNFVQKKNSISNEIALTGNLDIVDLCVIFD